MFKCDNILENYNCEYCCFMTDLKVTLKEHIWRCHISFHDYSKTNIGMKNYKCGYCNFTSYSIFMHYPHKNNCSLSDIKKCSTKTIYKEPLLCKVYDKGAWYKCNQCHFEAKTKRSLSVHVAMKHNHGSCGFCGYESRGKIDLQQHCINQHPDKIYRCTQCPYKTVGIEFMKSHIYGKHASATNVTKTAGNGLFKCNICNYRASKEGNLAFHLNLLHKTCFCGYQSKDSDDLQKHYEVHDKTKVHKCVQCSHKTVDYVGSNNHIFQSDGTYKCPDCLFKTSKVMNSHNSSKHVNLGLTLLYQCTRCNYRAPSRPELTAHMTWAHNTNTI